MVALGSARFLLWIAHEVDASHSGQLVLCPKCEQSLPGRQLFQDAPSFSPLA
jgi:hypothetical protein